MTLLVGDLEIPKEWYQKKYPCLAMKPAYEYYKGVRIDNIIGYRYEVVVENAKNALCKVLVKNATPLPLDFSSGEIPKVAFENLTIVPYLNNFYKKQIFIRGDAENVFLVD